MITYPDINPIALSLGPLQIRWYGIMYLLGFFLGGLALIYRAGKQKPSWSANQVWDFLFYVIFGVIIGGRLGYVLFYGGFTYFHEPLRAFAIWEGGMSFHGGLLGVLVAVLIYSAKTNRTFFSITDFIAPVVPIGLAAGRLGNFINGELWGKATEVPWGMIYPFVDNQPRHPSQLYECGLEGVLLFLILWFYSAKPRERGAVSAAFAIFYSLFRMFVEFFREPDLHIGYLGFHWLTMGQVLSIPMLFIGIYIYWLSTKKQVL